MLQESGCSERWHSGDDDGTVSGVGHPMWSQCVSSPGLPHSDRILMSLPQNSDVIATGRILMSLPCFTSHSFFKA